MRRTKLFMWLAAAAVSTVAANGQDWGQWMKNAQHTGAVSSAGQSAAHMLADIVYDPFVDQEKADPLSFGDLSVHYQAPLIDGNNVYMEFKTGTYTKLQTWETQIWNERRLSWQGNNLNTVWSFQSDWKPVPYGTKALGPAWEPVFHAALAGSFIYVPGFGG